MANQGPPFLGKFRATVSDNRDPLMKARVRVKAQDVYGDEESGWALPALPYTGNGVGLFLIPPTGASVWVEFEHGDPDYPIWAGGFWADGEAPASPAVAEMKVLKTDTATITLNDTPGAGGVTTFDTVTLTAADGAVLPAASRACAVRVCVPLATAVVFHETV